MAQKKAINIQFSVKSDLENQIERASQIYQDTNIKIGELGKIVSVLTSLYNSGSDVYTKLYEQSNFLEKQLKELGIPNDPIIGKARKLADSLKKIGQEEVRPYLFK
jgi:hypothetical protein